MKYIFNLYWFNNGGSNQLQISPGDYQTEPQGGWQNWTVQHNVLYMLNMIENGEGFWLVGDIADLFGQASNAGSKKTRSMVGCEILILLGAGYTVTKVDRTPPYLLCFTPPNVPSFPDLRLVTDAYQYLAQKDTSSTFWTALRKRQVQNCLAVFTP